MFEIAKNWPRSKSPLAQEWINNNGIFKQPDTAVKMNQSLMLGEMLSQRELLRYDSTYTKFKTMQNKQCVYLGIYRDAVQHGGKKAPRDSGQRLLREGKKQSGVKAGAPQGFSKVLELRVFYFFTKVVGNTHLFSCRSLHRTQV